MIREVCNKYGDKIESKFSSVNDKLKFLDIWLWTQTDQEHSQGPSIYYVFSTENEPLSSAYVIYEWSLIARLDLNKKFVLNVKTTTR